MDDDENSRPLHEITQLQKMVRKLQREKDSTAKKHKLYIKKLKMGIGRNNYLDRNKGRQ
jgi:hypothetical protein